MVKQIVKRNGNIVDFDPLRIKIAIFKALKASQEVSENSEGDALDQKAIEVTDQVIKKLEDIETVEHIQDVVEKTLMLFGLYDTAKKYIIYRNDRSKIRPHLPSNSFKHLVDESSKYFDHDLLREFVYYRTYSRWIPSKHRREVWIETVDRYISFMQESLGNKLSPLEYDEIRTAILKQEVMPSMRLMQFAGDPVRRCNVCAYNCSYTTITDLRDFAEIMYLSMCGTGVGFSVEHRYIDQLPVIQPQQIPPKINHYQVADSKEGWSDAFLFVLQKWYNGQDVDVDYSKLRGAGTRLKTMGGRSSGPDALRYLIEFTRKIILANQGKKLSTLNVHDIICKVGEIVVSGGVRRTALISLSDLKDAEMRDSKKSTFWETNSQRCMANNSAVYLTKPSALEFIKEWLSLAESGTGERGIFNRSSFHIQLPTRRLHLINNSVGDLGTNPCVTKDVWIHTVEGPRQVKDLIGQKIPLYINGHSYPVESDGFFYTGNKKIFQIVTEKGYTLKLTDNHPILLKKSDQLIWTPLKETKIGDQVSISNHRNILSWPGNGTYEEGLNCKVEVNDEIEKKSSEFYKGFIQQFFNSADTNIISNSTIHLIKCCHSNPPSLLRVQRMLSRFGIISEIWSVEPNKLLIKDDNVNLLCRLIDWPIRIPPDVKSETFLDTIVSITEIGYEDVYDVTVNTVHEFCGNGIRLHNCGEILLKPKQFCNLSEVICRPHDTLDSLLRKIRIATIIGTYQSTLTNFNYISDQWRINQEQERLLGVSLTGQWDCPPVRQSETLIQLKECAIEVNRVYAERFGINPSTSITCSKPSGTVSQLTNASSGIHPRFSPYYIRRVRISGTDPLFKVMKDQGIPYHPEVGQLEETATTFVLEFPVKSPDSAICANMSSALDQLEYWKKVKINYTEHNPSCTIYIRDDEWLKVGHWLYENWDYIGGLSFLPYSDHVYKLAPYESISPEKYQQLCQKIPNIAFDKLIYYELEDLTDQKREIACANGICEL